MLQVWKRAKLGRLFGKRDRDVQTTPRRLFPWGKELYRRNGARVVSAGCGRTWVTPNGCDRHTGGKLRCTRWCTYDFCNGRRGKLSKLGSRGAASTIIRLTFSLFSPVLLAYVFYFGWWERIGNLFRLWLLHCVYFELKTNKTFNAVVSCIRETPLKVIPIVFCNS